MPGLDALSGLAWDCFWLSNLAVPGSVCAATFRINSSKCLSVNWSRYQWKTAYQRLVNLHFTVRQSAGLRDTWLAWICVSTCLCGASPSGSFTATGWETFTNGHGFSHFYILSGKNGYKYKNVFQLPFLRSDGHIFLDLLLSVLLSPSSALKMEAVYSSEALASTDESALIHNVEERRHLRENLRYYTVIVWLLFI
jgi:hypothetical protein